MRKARKTWSAVVSLLLAFSLAFGMTVPAFAVEADSDANGAGEKKTYVSLGASNVNGYGLRGYIQAADGMTIDETYEAAALDSSIKDNANVLGYTAEAPGSYPVLIAEELDYDLEQLAISSMRAEELRILLDNDYYGDSYSAWRFVGAGKWFEIATPGGIDTLREEYQSKIAAADLITVDVGANNFGVYISHQLTSNYRYDNDLSLIDPALADQYAAAQGFVRELVAEYAPEYSDDLLGMKDLVDTMAYALVGFCVNFDIVMEKIYELNPYATVVAVSIQNLMEGYEMAVPGIEDPLPVGDIFGALVNAANIYIAVGSPYSDSYLCADVRQDGRVECFLEDIISYNGDPASLSPEVIDCFDVLDGSPGNGYDRNLHVKYMLNKATGGSYTDSMLNAAYDAVASILQAAAQVSVIDPSVLSGSGAAEDAFEEAFAAQIMAAAAAAQADPGYDYALPENFFESVALEAGVPVSSVESVAALYVRTDIGNTFFGHPNFNGHKVVANTILDSLENGVTGKEILTKGVFEGRYQVTEDSKYVAIGDSTVASLAQGSTYAQLLAQHIADVASEGQVTFDPQSQDDFAVLGGQSLLAQDILAKIESGEWSDQIASADLITLSVGVENLTTAVNSQLIGIVSAYITGDEYQPVDQDWAALVGEEGAAKVDAALKSLKAEILAAAEDPDAAAILVNILECYAYGYTGFATSYNDILSGIRALNPDAQIVAVGLNNFFDGFVLDMNGTQINVGDYFKYIIRMADIQSLAYAMIAEDDGITFVSAPEADSDAAGMLSEIFAIVSKGMPTDIKGKLAFLSAMSDLKSLFSDAESIPSWMPNAAGHEYICAQITDAVEIWVAKDAQSIEDAKVTLSSTEFTYNAKAQKPSATVVLDGKTLQAGTDYTVTYADNVNVGTATAIVTGKGAYEGSVTATFEIAHLATAGLFSDFAKGSWYLSEEQGAFAGSRTLYMDYTLATGLMSGYSNSDEFGPYDPLTRAQAATILYRLANPGSTDTTVETDYADANTTGLSDVKAGQYYTAAVNWAKDQGIITGYLTGKNAGKFLPDGKVTRQELATMIYRFCMQCSGAEAAFADVSGFDDSGLIASWAVEGLGFCGANGIMSGVYGTNLLNPAGNANRAEMAKMIAVTAHDVM